MAKAEAAFSLETFEFLCYSRDRELATRELMKLLNTLEVQYGALAGIKAKLGSTVPALRNTALLTRITAALSSLFSDPEFFLSPQGFGQLISWQRWISTLFAASPFGNADHVLRSMNVKGPDADLELTETSFVKFCLLYSPDSDIPVDVQTLWSYNRKLAAALFFSLLAPRFLGTEAAHSKREALLGWLPAKLDELQDLDELPLAILHDVFMNCSYADRADKHEIKRSINKLVRKKLLKEGFNDLDVAAPRGVENGKPVMLVVLEWFTSKHSIYRTHSASLRALRDKFYVVALGGREQVDEAGRAVFDEFIPLGSDIRPTLERVRAEATKRKPAIVYYPSIGMFQPMIYLANMRLAPIQLTALGHGASSMAPLIDYYAIEEDIAGDPATYSEKLFLLPKDAMPHVRSSDATSLTPQLREAPEMVRVSVGATTMKLNPRFIKTCVAIASAARTPVQFEFLIGFANGLTHEQVRRFIHSYLPDANVYSHQPYAQYMAVINSCDLFLDPFPYGNMNGNADMASVGLVGVCRTGPQIHESIDGGLFARMGFPDWLTTRSDDDYIAAAVRLIDHPKERLELRRALIARGSDEILLKGRPQILGERLSELVAAAR